MNLPPTANTANHREERGAAFEGRDAPDARRRGTSAPGQSPRRAGASAATGESEAAAGKLGVTARERTFEQARLDHFARRGAAVASRRIRDRNGRTLYHLETRGDGPPVIFVHGGGSQAGEWAPLLPHLSGSRRHLVVDRPGHGLSYKLNYTGIPIRQAAVEYVTDLLDGLGIERATLVGNSMGGYFALCFAHAFPGRVERLVLLGAPAGVDRWLPPPLRLMGLRGVNRLLFRAMRESTPQQLRAKLFGRLLVAHPEKVADDFLSLVKESNGLPGAETSWRTLLEEVTTLCGFRRRCYIREEVARLATPTTFIWGERDAFAPPASGEDLARRMPHATLVKIPDAGHLPWIDAPDACTTAVENALGP